MPKKQARGTATGGQALTSKMGGAFEWRCIGPHRGGRVVAVAGDPIDPMTFYFGACAGGVWKTVDGGTYWECVSDDFFKTAAVGAIAVSDSDPNVIYAGMGETCIRGNVSHGDGVYRSTDAGKTWANLGLSDTRHIAKVRIHPQNPDLVYVAALGHAYGPNKERGIYRSKDGGRSWEQILFRSEKAGAIDLSMDPNNPRTLYAAMWEAQRSPYSLTSGGEGSSLYKSTDGGDTWIELTDKPGLPTGIKGKIGIAVSPARTDRVWALVEAEDGSLFRSEDGGESWQRICDDDRLRWRAWYYMHLYADPQDPDTCWVLDLHCLKSVDGGATFNPVPTPHGDNHDLWIDPKNPRRMIEGNDGGACVTFNGGYTWSSLMNQPTAQFYHVTTDTQDPYRVYGSQQDNAAISVASFSMYGTITTADAYKPGGGESGYIAVRPDNPNIVFGGAIGSGFGNGKLTRYDHRTQQWRNITVWPLVTGLGSGAEDLKYRFQWTFPVVISPHDPNVLYVAANQLFRSTNDGESWDVISPDLTRHDPSKLRPSGGPITKDNTGAEVYCTIFAFAESPHEKGVFWAGSDDGLVHISRNGGLKWEKVTPPGLPEWSLISMIEPSPHDKATAYMAATRYKLDDLKPYLYETTDYGKTWRLITNGIPKNDFTRVIRADPNVPGVLYAGTETGVYVSLDDGVDWQPLRGNLAAVPIHDLVIKGTDMIVATHGRSFWVLDDLTALLQLAEDPKLTGVRLFTPRATVRRQVYDSSDGTPTEYTDYTHGNGTLAAARWKKKPDGTYRKVLLDAGQNPPNGAVITYYLPDRPAEDITLTFLDSEGRTLREFTSRKPEDKNPDIASAEGEESPELEMEKKDEKQILVPNQGANRFVWNLRLPDATTIPDDKSLEYGPLPGPVVLPGKYQVRLRVGTQSLTESFEVLKDPRTGNLRALRQQFDLLLVIRDKVSETHEAIIQLREIRKQIESWEQRLAKQKDADGLRKTATGVKKKLTDIEKELIQVKAGSALQPPMKLNAQMAALSDFVTGVDAAPPPQVREVMNELSAAINVQLGRLQTVIQSDVAAFNEQIREADLPAVAYVQ